MKKSVFYLLNFQTNIIHKSTSTYQLPNSILTFIFYYKPLNKNLISIPLPSNILLPDFEINKTIDRKNVVINSCYFSENNSFDGNLLGASNVNNKTFSNNKNEEKLIFAFEKDK